MLELEPAVKIWMFDPSLLRGREQTHENPRGSMTYSHFMEDYEPQRPALHKSATEFYPKGVRRAVHWKSREYRDFRDYGEE